jgi:hypothetical protein
MSYILEIKMQKKRTFKQCNILLRRIYVFVKSNVILEVRYLQLKPIVYE